MLIRILHRDGKLDRVTPQYLDHLINLHEVARFERTEGWVTLGIDPIRAMRNRRYRGPERRKNH